MRRGLVLAILAIVLQTLFSAADAQAQESEIDCNSFVKNSDGSWTVTQKVYIPVQKIRVNEGVTFTSDQLFLGIDMVARLNNACPQVTAQPQQPAAPPVAGVTQPPPPQQALSRYADANGNIDVQRLTCAHLDDASGAEADLLLAWYSGWYNGVAKKRGINLARVRYAIRSAADYCKANPDKSLTQVMELMLK
jgi:hypothetical protein